jgi:predicted PurR-regulated permease PerM
MSSDSSNRRGILKENGSLTTWLKRLIVSLTFLVWLALTVAVLWMLGHVSTALILLAIGATIATVVYPLVNWLERKMPRPLAVAIVYTLVFCALGGLLYFLINTIINQILSLIQYIQSLINSNGNNQINPILDTLRRFGISQSELRLLGQNLIGQLQGIVNNVVPFVSNIFGIILNMVLVALLSIYFLVAGPHITYWLRHKTPKRLRGGTNFLLDTLEQVIGRNFRGSLLMSTIISTITGVGLYFIGVPYPILLSALAFVLEFIPVVGFYVTAITVVLFALTQGWVTGLVALGFVILLQALEGEILAPRIIGGAIGIHPIIMIAALIAGGQLYGILGIFYSGPAAGLIQAIVLALWSYWKQSHPDQFPQEKHENQQQGQEEASN